MRVLLANSTCKVGGVSTFLLSLRRALVAAGHSCELFFFQHGTMDPHLPDGWPIHFGSLADLLRLVDRQRFDIVHANNVDWPTGIAAVRGLGARLVLTAHKVRPNATYGWYRSNSDAFAAVADWIRRDLQPSTDLAIDTVHNGVDTERFRPADEGQDAATPAPIVAWIGRAGSPHKRMDRLAAAAPHLRAAGLRVWVIDQHGPAALADLYGRDAAERLAACADRWDAVSFDQMPALYRQVAASGGCVLSTSESEGLPLTLLEAQACGCPVVASDVRGNNECVAVEGAGVLYAADEPPARVASLITRTLAGRHATAAGQEAAAFARTRFSLDVMAARYLDIYQARRAPAARPLGARVRARARLSPLTHWADYMDYRWGTAAAELDASRALAARGERRAAAAAARAAVRTAPSLFVKPARLSYLFHTLRHGRQPRPGDASMIATLLRRFDVTPREKTPKICGTDEIFDGRKPRQMGWYGFAAEQFAGEEVLDVGCGSGEGLKLIAARASRAVGIDLDERLRRPDLEIHITSIADLPDKSFDNVVCMDVIEHVADDRAFVAELFRVARKSVFVTTPNYTMSRNRHPYHVREYTPAEFERLFDGYGAMTLFAGSAHGHERVVVRNRWRYFLVNALYTWTPTLLAAKVLKRLLRVTVWKHNAALVRLPQAGAGKGSKPAAAA